MYPSRFLPWILILGMLTGSCAKADTPALLAKAIQHWDAGLKDLAFTQRTTTLGDKDAVRETRVERYDPSLPDNQRWRLQEINGRPPTEEERRKWEDKKNGRPRKKGGKPPSDYLDLPNARLIGETGQTARFEVGLRPEAARLVPVEKLSALITVDKSTGDITHIAAILREPMKIALGLAKVTDVDFDLQVEPEGGENKGGAGEVKPGSTAKVVLSKFGDPVEYKWSDFKRVTAYGS